MGGVMAGTRQEAAQARPTGPAPATYTLLPGPTPARTACAFPVAGCGVGSVAGWGYGVER